VCAFFGATLSRRRFGGFFTGILSAFGSSWITGFGGRVIGKRGSFASDITNKIKDVSGVL
jgi:hypothetical protein